jgi:uncharacterized protein YbjT (DUF2867 family)
MKLVIVGGNIHLQRSVAQSLAGTHHVHLVSHSASPDSAQLEPTREPNANPAVIHDVPASFEAAIVLDRSLLPLVLADEETEPESATEALLQLASQSGARRVLFVCSPTGNTGVTKPWESAQAPEWLVLRCAPVYGIVDDAISQFLFLMRAAPVVPIISDTQAMWPLWQEDLSQALAVALDLPSHQLQREVDLAGPERVTHSELYDKIAALIDRRPLRVPLPEFLAKRAPAKLAPFIGATGHGSRGADTLRTMFGITPTALDAGLNRLIKTLPEVTPGEGVGTVEVKRFGTLIRGSRYDAAGLLREFRTHFADVMPVPIGVEPALPATELHEGETLSIALPGRGHVQIRVEEATPRHVVVGTLRGHVVAGVVRFATRDVPDGVRFEVMTCDAAANAADWLSLTLGSTRIQDANWARVVQNVVKLSGGQSDGIEHDARRLDDDEAAAVQRWINEVIGKQSGQSAGGQVEVV